MQYSSLKEVSGIAASRHSPGVLWAHNDAGDSARVFAMTTSGTHLGIYNLTGASAVDWEDMAIGPGPEPGVEYLYIADTGDNDRNRSSITIYRVPEPGVSANQSPASVNLGGVEAFPMRYPGNRFDCETLLVDPLSGDIILVTRDRINEGYFYVFSYPVAQQVPGVMFTLQLVAWFPWNVQVKGGDVSAQGDMVILRPHSGSVAVNALWWNRIVGPTPEQTEPLWNVFSRTACLVPAVSEEQGEAVAFRPDGLGYYTISEGSSKPVYFYAWEFPPAKPSGLSATPASSSRINLFWVDNSTNETGFAIERSADSLTFAPLATVGPNVVSYADTKVAGDKTYYYRVRAYNTAYSSDFTDVVAATTPPVPPATPSSLKATAVSKSQINLTWTDKSNNETEFRIERGLSSSTSSFTQIAVVGAGVQAFSDTGLAAGKTYYYRVRAANAGGSSAYSSKASAKTFSM